MTTRLRKALGPIPHGYKVEKPRNDYQVVINGPVGRAVIHEVNDGEDYEVETAFDREKVRLYHGIATPSAAMELITRRSSISLTMIGVTPTSTNYRWALWLAGIAAVILSLVAVLTVLGVIGYSDGEQPTAPVTWSPATSVTPSYDIPAPTPGATR